MSRSLALHAGNGRRNDATVNRVQKHIQHLAIPYWLGTTLNTDCFNIASRLCGMASWAAAAHSRGAGQLDAPKPLPISSARERSFLQATRAVCQFAAEVSERLLVRFSEARGLTEDRLEQPAATKPKARAQVAAM